MNNIALYLCGEVSKKCTANGCMRAFNEKKDSFSGYDKGPTQIVAINTCNGCDQEPVDSLKLKIEKLKKADVGTVHLSTCIRGRCEHYENFARMCSEHFDVIGYTHGSSSGKKNNTINLLKKSEKRKK